MTCVAAGKNPGSPGQISRYVLFSSDNPGSPVFVKILVLKRRGCVNVRMKLLRWYADVDRKTNDGVQRQSRQLARR